MKLNHCLVMYCHVLIAYSVVSDTNLIFCNCIIVSHDKIHYSIADVYKKPFFTFLGRMAKQNNGAKSSGSVCKLIIL